MTPRPPAWFAGNEQTKRWSQFDCRSRYSAERLAKRIEDIWRAHGFGRVVICRVERTPDCPGFVQIRSNLINGLPP